MIGPTASDTAFKRDTLALAEELTDRAWGLIYSLRVDSVTNYQHTEADGDDLRVAPLIENATSLSDAEIVQVREIATTEPLLIGRLTSESGATVAVNVVHRRAALDDSEVGEVAAEVKSAVALNEAQIAALKEKLKSVYGKDVQLEAKIDPSLLGGLIVKIGSRMFDSTLKTKLANMKVALKGAS